MPHEIKSHYLAIKLEKFQCILLKNQTELTYLELFKLLLMKSLAYTTHLIKNSLSLFVIE